jgi:hypothetical protein
MNMYFRRMQQAAAAAAFLIFLPSALLAQRIDSPYRWVERGLSGGAYAGTIATGQGAVDVGPASGPVLGGRFSLRLSGPFTGEADIALMTSTRMVLDTVAVDGEWQQIGEGDVRIGMLLAGLRFNVTGQRTMYGLQPFVVVGGGLARDFAGAPTLPEGTTQGERARHRFGTSFAGQFGAGVEWFATERLALRGDARNVLWRLRYPEAFRTAAPEALLPASDWVSNYQFAAGVSIYF